MPPSSIHYDTTATSIDADSHDYINDLGEQLCDLSPQEFCKYLDHVSPNTTNNDTPVTKIEFVNKPDGREDTGFKNWKTNNYYGLMIKIEPDLESDGGEAVEDESHHDPVR